PLGRARVASVNRGIAPIHGHRTGIDTLIRSFFPGGLRRHHAIALPNAVAASDRPDGTSRYARGKCGGTCFGHGCWNCIGTNIVDRGRPISSDIGTNVIAYLTRLDSRRETCRIEVFLTGGPLLTGRYLLIGRRLRLEYCRRCLRVSWDN